MAGRRSNPQGSVFSYTLKSGSRRWAFVIDVGEVRDGACLKRQQLKRSGFTRQLDAQRALEKELPAIRAETALSLADRQTTLSEYLDKWLGIGRKANGDPWRPSTKATYKTSVENYIRPGLGRYRVEELRRSHVESLAEAMRDGTIRPDRYKHTTPLSQRTVHQARATLRACLTQAVADGLIATNPCQGARVPGPGRSDMQVWAPEQVAAFLDHAREREPRLAAAYQLCALRGLRRGEALGLRWADIDLDGGTLRVVRSVTEADRTVHVGPPKTQRGARTVSIGPDMVAALRAHRKAQAAERLAAREWHEEDWVFPGPDGRVLAPHVLTHKFLRLVRELPELPELHLHSLRGVAITLMLLGGVAPKVVADQVGHSKVQMTLDVYAQVFQSQRDESADVVEALFRPAVTAL